MMIVVAKRLSKIALEEASGDDVDAFGRSAFNRYYYASYLIIRNMIDLINSSWTRTGHSEIPKLLRGPITKRINDEVRKQSRGKLISKSDASWRISEARRAAQQLAELMEGAYHVRCVADYEPEKRVLRDGNVITLIAHTTKEADNWPKRAGFHVGELLRICKTLGLCE
jgi:hypothetical protein